MPALQLGAAFSRNAMTQPILDGRIVPEGIEWACSAIHPSEMFWRQLRFGEFDVSEMSLSSLFISVIRGNLEWVALPIFTTRRFFHTAIVVRAGAAIDRPEDLVDKRVGVPEYQQTAAVWSRGALQHEFGVTADQFSWFMERSPSRSHGGATSFTPPTGVDLQYISETKSIGSMLAVGELDAAIVYIADSNLVDRSRTAVGALPAVRPLFQDPVAEGIRYYRSSGLLPVNHCVVVRAAALERNPWVALNVYSAFLRAKEVALANLPAMLEPYRQIGAIPADAVDMVGTTDPLPYGIAGQRNVLEALATYLTEQGLASRRVEIEEVFARSVLDL